MSERGKPSGPEHGPKKEKSVEEKRQEHVEDLKHLNEEDFKAESERVENEFGEAERKMVEGIDFEEITDLRGELENFIDAETHKGIESWDSLDDEARRAIKGIFYMNEVRKYLEATYPTPEEGEEDPHADEREKARRLLGMSDERFKSFSRRWDNYEAVQTAKEEMEMDEAYGMNEKFDRRERGLQEGDEMIVDGKKYEVRKIDLDDEGNPAFAIIRITNVDASGNPTGRPLVRRGTIEEMTSALPAEMTGADLEISELDETKTETTEGKRDLEGDIDDAVERLDKLHEELEREARKSVDELLEEMEELNDRLQEMLEDLRDGESNYDDLDDKTQELRDLLDQIDAEVARRREEEEGPEADEEDERGLLKRAWDFIRNPSAWVQWLADRKNSRYGGTLTSPEGDEGPEKKSRVLKWAVGSLAVAIALGLAYGTGRGWFTGDELQAAAPPEGPKGGGSAAQELAAQPQVDAGPEFSTGAYTVEEGEGWFNTFNELDVKPQHNQALLNEVGPRLESMGLAYKLSPELGGYGISNPGTLPKEALTYIHDIAEQRGYLK